MTNYTDALFFVTYFFVHVCHSTANGRKLPATDRKIERCVVQKQIEPSWISYADAERLVGLSRVTLWRLLKSGEVKSASIGRARRISRQSLEDYLERQASKASK